ncbi:MAG: autotransporter domain-containing protein [Gammaproteobacteria bacterium]|nr:autotransporter domain-containing protein [Gammaproteobacteria bacterium]
MHHSNPQVSNGFRPFFLAFLLSSAFFVSGITLAQERHVFLGDSLVDNQNSYIATSLLQPTSVIPASPPYWEGRFSNGPNWTDRLAPNQLYYMDYYFGSADCSSVNANNGLASVCGATTSPGAQPGASLSFAFGGAKAGDQTLPGAAPGMATVIDDLIRFQRTGEVANLAGSTFNILTGGNDYTNYVVSPQGLSEQSVVDQTLSLIDDGISRLATLQPKRVVVLNLFDLQRVPTLVADFNAVQLAQSGRLSALHNSGLRSSLEIARGRTGLDIVLVDLAALYDDIHLQADRYGFTNLQGSCLKTDGSGTTTGSCNDPASTAATLFWDGQHPTTAAHGYIAELVNATLLAVDQGGAQLTHLTDTTLLQTHTLNRALRGKSLSGTSEGFVITTKGQGRQPNTASFGGYDYDQQLLLAGFAFNPLQSMSNMQLGAHVAKLSLDGHDGNGFSLDNRALALGGFARWQRDDFSLGGHINLLQFELDDLVRPTGFSVLPSAWGTTDGWGLSVELDARLERRVALGDSHLNLALQGHLSANRAHLNGYTERDASFLALQVDSSTLSDLRTGLAFSVWGELPVEGGMLQPRLEIGLEHDLAGDPRKASAHLSSGQSVLASVTAPGSTRMNLDLGLSYSGHRGLRADLTLAAQFDNNGERLLLQPQLTLMHTF